MVIAWVLLKLWSWELEQTAPYNVPELFRGVPRPKHRSKMSQTCIKIALPTGQKRKNLDFFDAPQAEESSVSPMLGQIIKQYVKMHQTCQNKMKIQATAKSVFLEKKQIQVVSQSLRRLLWRRQSHK